MAVTKQQLLTLLADDDVRVEIAKIVAERLFELDQGGADATLAKFTAGTWVAPHKLARGQRGQRVR